MMMNSLKTLSTAIMIFLILAGSGAQAAEEFGGDVYAAGANAAVSAGSQRDAFVAGFNATLDGDVAADGHAMGFDVEANGPVGGDLYAVGASVSIGGSIGEDLTASGFSVRVGSRATVGGNARVSGGSVVISGPVGGSLAAAGGSIELDAAVEGDVRLVGAEITFGDDARIGGQLTYSAPSEITIPASVIDPERVRYQQLARSETMGELHDMFGERSWSAWPSFFGLLSAFIVTLAFLVLIAAVFIAVMPETVERTRKQAIQSPGASLLAGFLGLATLFGLVPVSAMTLVGLPFIPIVILLIILSWTLAYILGAYVVSARLANAFGQSLETTLSKLLVLAAGFVALAIMNFIPFAGWLINLTVVLLGLGAIAVVALGRNSGRWTGQQPVEGEAVKNLEPDPGKPA